MARNERPGVYASCYAVSSAPQKTGASLGVGVAGRAYDTSSPALHRIESRTQAVSLYGLHSELFALIDVLLQNGCNAVTAVCVGGEGAQVSDYEDAFSRLAADGQVDIMICDSEDGDVHAALREVLGDESFRMAVLAAQGEVTELTERALALNDERVLLLHAGADAAAAFAGYLSAHPDPTASLSGAVLLGTDTGEESYTDLQINSLVRGGVIPVEDGSIVRAVTTRTMTDGEPDSAYREVTTLRIMAAVIPTVKNALRSRFSGGRNDDRTRGAIRTQVLLELEKLRKRQLIESYGEVSAVPDADDPTVCAVSFAFRAVHALETIELTACVTV